jgi:CrcB protein
MRKLKQENKRKQNGAKADMALNILAVGIGGFIGASLRYGLSRALPFAAFPLATLCANAVAGFAIGAMFGLDAASPVPPKLKLFVNTGILGGLSTFSTFSLETVSLFQGGKYLIGGGYVLLSLALSLAGVAAGMALAKGLAG